MDERSVARGAAFEAAKETVLEVKKAFFGVD
jgi:hypothetical protein